ncbi:unnamed protein product [Bursaphelenchus okinawaensis]|uniref:Uncharacterized protein n=1 Tax=Bursaphelenchus okinawaensis TaxID=465554 RepID=A0A811KE16_9BILA|nr:unnamed protein product [Bursaphelenchus okinawaensis]CAG9102013.1 unnamed protein product [Bursaphelenchus okinawaensis]
MVFNCSVEITQLDPWQLAQIYPPPTTTLAPIPRYITELENLFDMNTIIYCTVILVLFIMVLLMCCIPCCFKKRETVVSRKSSVKEFFLTSTEVDPEESLYGSLPSTRPTYIRNRPLDASIIV